MKTTISSFIISTALLCLLPATCGGQGRAPKQITLLTPGEAAQFRLTEEEWKKPVMLLRTIPKGPRIVFKKPEVKETSTAPTIEIVSPIAFSISFEKNLSPVNMDSVKIVVKKGFISKSITDLLRPCIQGTLLEAQGVQLPPGKYEIQIHVQVRAPLRQ